MLYLWTIKPSQTDNWEFHNDLESWGGLVCGLFRNAGQCNSNAVVTVIIILYRCLALFVFMKDEM